MLDIASKFKMSDAYIDGQWTKGNSGKSFAVTNPANGAHLADVADATGDDALRAVAAAKAAFKPWAAKTAKQAAISCANGTI